MNITGRTNHFSVFRANRKDAHALQSDNIKCVLPDDDGVYIGSHGGGLSYLSTRTRQIKNYTFPGAVSFNNSCYSLLDGQDGTIWVGASSDCINSTKRPVLSLYTR